MNPENSNREIEVMAPVGSYEALASAIRAGADSIYFGVGQMNMRSRSSANFEFKDLTSITKKCRKVHIKSYLVLNTIVYDEELQEIQNICDAAKQAQVDAIIASDIAVIEYAHSIKLTVHISVQANVCNISAVKFYSQYADVMVLARELTLPQIKNIINAIKTQNITGPSGNLVKIEIFAHGALCVSVSGKCYMSLASYDTSANRGACYQNCRRSYRVTDEQTGDELIIDNKYVMSPKDICTISVIDQLLNAGVSILKLEGRGRAPDYVHTVTEAYRKAVDAWKNNTFSEEKALVWLNDLRTVFNRDFWMGGYYLGEKMGEWCGVDGNISTLNKEYIGKVNKYFAKIKIAELHILAKGVKVGQELLITGPTTGAVKHAITGIRFEEKDVSEVPQNSVISLPFPVKVRKNDKVFLLTKRKFGEPKI